MGLFQSKLFRWTLFGGLLTLAAMCSPGAPEDKAVAPEPSDHAELTDESSESEEPETERPSQVQHVNNAQPATTSVEQGLVQAAEQCLDFEICTRDWGLQTLGIAMQVRADALLKMAREHGAPEEWLTAHMQANRDLLSQETALLGGVLDGSARQNEIATQRAFEMSATAIALQMHQSSKLPTGDATNVNQLLTFSQSLLQQQYAKFPHLTADTREQIEEALPESDDLAGRMARSVNRDDH